MPTAPRPLPSPHGSLRSRVWTAGRWALLLAGLAATYGVFLLTSMRIAIKVREVTVPDVRGQAVDTASQTLEDLGLTVVLDPLRRPDAVVPADHIWAQDPVAGTVIRRQRPVRIRVSDGMQAAAVPAVIGESERSAQILLAQDRISLTQTSDINSADYAPGVVVAQDPPAKSQAPGVALLVNRGEDGLTYVMPDLIGTSGARVAEILRRRLFRVTIVGEVPYPDLPSGTVVRQSPQAGFQLAPGDPITLEISR
ncbi:MAG TPA: PASTA domain-containing protein [Vicinamibacterales bacterium]|nr:PASTA domain-containing protein [Acidobacteriota bacterium]HQX81113.1 PASTA domain-containing protein [Vicinamibacterales bacterium]